MAIRRWSALLGAVLLAACPPLRAANGELHIARFGFANNCTFYDCVGQVFASGGTHSDITVATGEDGCNGFARSLDFARAASTNDDVAHVDVVGGSQLRLTTGRAGSAKLELYDAADHLIDRYAIEVADPVTFGLPASQLLIEGNVTTLDVAARDAAGRVVTSDQVTLQTSGATSLTTQPPYAFPVSVQLNQALGTGTLTVSYGALTQTLDLEGVPLSAITSLVADRPALAVVAPVDVVAGDPLLSITALAGTRSVVGPVCEWTTSDPSLMGYGAAGTIDRPAMRNWFRATRAGNFTATCRVATASVTVEIDATTSAK